MKTVFYNAEGLKPSGPHYRQRHIISPHEVTWEPGLANIEVDVCRYRDAGGSALNSYAGEKTCSCCGKTKACYSMTANIAPMAGNVVATVLAYLCLDCRTW